MTNKILLQNALRACESLKKSFYKIIIGKNGHEVIINLHFPYDCFFHLLGLQYLVDIHELRNNRNAEREYDRLLKNTEFLREKVLNSQFLTEDVTSRWTALTKLEYILDNNLETYYDKKNYYGGRIDNINFDYAFHLKNGDTIISFYFIKNVGSNDYKMVSNFENAEPKRHCGRPFTLIKKTKVNLATNTVVELYAFGE